MGMQFQKKRRDIYQTNVLRNCLTDPLKAPYFLAPSLTNLFFEVFKSNIRLSCGLWSTVQVNELWHKISEASREWFLRLQEAHIRSTVSGEKKSLIHELIHLHTNQLVRRNLVEKTENFQREMQINLCYFQNLCTMRWTASEKDRWRHIYVKRWRNEFPTQRTLVIAWLTLKVNVFSTAWNDSQQLRLGLLADRAFLLFWKAFAWHEDDSLQSPLARVTSTTPCSRFNLLETTKSDVLTSNWEEISVANA